MEEIEERRSAQTSSFLVTVVFLTAMAVGLLAMFVLTVREASRLREARLALPVAATATAGSSQVESATASGPATAAAQVAARPHSDKKAENLLQTVAWISVALLGLTLVMIFGVVARFLRRRLAGLEGPVHSRTEYVDAWALAGKRAKPEPEPDDQEEGEVDSEGPEDGEGPDADPEGPTR